ncbi:MAG: HNH endonuclease [Methyloprofundus sp.]|nr:HNH endonuclease [Methyloprofundus sp.]
MTDLKLSIKKKLFRVHDGESLIKDAAYAHARPQILEKDEFTCRCCGFQSKPDKEAKSVTSLAYSGYLEVHHVDDDHGNNEMTNLMTVCPYCHQVFHFGFAGYRNAGFLVDLPEIDQATLNLMMHAVGISIHRRDEYSKTALSFYNDVLKKLKYRLEDRLGEGASDPAALSQALSVSGTKAYQNMDELLSGIRLVPNVDTLDTPFAKHIEYWSANSMMESEQWNNIFENFLKKK